MKELDTDESANQSLESSTSPEGIVEASSAETRYGQFLRDCEPTKATADVSLAGHPNAIAEFARTKDGGVPTWGEATMRFRARLSAESPHTPRFSGKWARRAWGRLLSLDQDYRQWADCTVLLTLTGRTTYPDDGGFLPPCTHFARLTDSRQARRQALSRSLRDIDRWCRVTVVGADSNGYSHLHVGVYVSELVDRQRFEPVIRSHVDNSPIAEWDAHGAGAIQVEPEPSLEEPTGLVGYLGLNVPGLDTRGNREAGILSEPDHRVRGATVLEAGNRQAIRLS